ncbi:hypothetical protein Tco_0932939, partial [Tanacetum coccineum]
LGLQVKQKEDGIFISQDKYVAEILKKFDFASVADDNVGDLLTKAFDVSRYINDKVAGKPVTISEASIRSDLRFDDVDGIDSLNNQAIFDAIKLMGYEGDLTVLTFNKALFLPQWKFLFHTLNNCLSSKSTYWDQIPTNIATAVICLTSNQKFNFSKLIFDGMLRHLDAPKKFVMYPRFISIFLSNQLKNVPILLDHFPIHALSNKVFSFMVKNGKHFSGKVTPLFPNMLVQPTEDEGEGSERPSEPQPTPSPPYPSEAHVEPQSDPSPGPSPTIPIPDPILEGSGGNLGTQAVEIKSLKAQLKKLKKQAMPFILHHKAWLKTVKRKNQNKKKVLKTSKRRSVFKQGRKTVKSSKGAPTLEPRESTSSAAQTTPTPTPTTFGDDEMIVQVLLNISQAKPVSKEKETRVEIRNAERPRTTSTRSVLTLKPLPKIDPNDKGKKRIEEDEESDTESEEITEAKTKFDQIAHDEEVARKIALSNEYDFIQARIEADRLLAERVQEEEREQFTVEERAKFLHDTIATQRRILAQQRTKAIRNKPPIKNQFRNQMVTYLKHVGNKKHADLKTKSFDEIKALYEKVKRFDDSFITISSTKDERKIKEMNEGASNPDKKKKIVKEDVSAKVPAKQDVAEQGTKKRKGGHMKMIARKRKRPQLDVDKGDYLVVYRVNGNFRAFNYLMEVLHIFDRQDLFHLYDLVMKQYSESTPEGIELILWGDLKIMMESSIEVTDQGDFWNDQQDWEIVTWRLYEACGVCILEFKDGTVIHMLVERKYPLSKELLQRMLDFGLEVEVESTAALDLIRVLNSPCFMVKSWLVQDQTVLGKDYSNLLIADSLLKTIWFINAPCYGNEALASPKANGLTIPEQTATGKGISNPFMAGSLPKTTKPT